MVNVMKYDDMTLHPVKGQSVEYNSTREALKMPEYGRLVQDMVEYALTIADKAERQQYAETIIAVMTGLNPKMKDVSDYRHKLWDHLAYISGYQLDIDYPFEIEKKDVLKRPQKLSYPKGNIRFRHYGRLIEKALNDLQNVEDDAERDALVQLIGNRMKRNLADWKGDGVEDSKVARDIAYYTEGKVQPDFTQKGKKLMQIGDSRFRTRKNKGLF